MNIAKIVATALGVIIVILLGVLFFVPAPQGAPSLASKEDLIFVSTPRIGERIKSPVIISGDARGYWFFEASFPIKILDKKGNLLGQGIAQAEREWMTEDLVPFRAKVEFQDPEPGPFGALAKLLRIPARGFLVLEKDNPSGLPEHADELRIQVRF